MLHSTFPSTAIWKRYVQACCDFTWCQELHCLIRYEWCSRICLSIYAPLTMPKGLSDLWFIRQCVGCLINLHVCSTWYSGQFWLPFFHSTKLSFLCQVKMILKNCWYSDDGLVKACNWCDRDRFNDLCLQSVHPFLTQGPQLCGIPCYYSLSHIADTNLLLHRGTDLRQCVFFAMPMLALHIICSLTTSHQTCLVASLKTWNHDFIQIYQTASCCKIWLYDNFALLKTLWKFAWWLQWSFQGVLLLNAALTVRAHEANSHNKKGWEDFTTTAIQALSKHRKGLVFLLWGKNAQAVEKLINVSKHHILKTVHPSGLSANRVSKADPCAQSSQDVHWFLTHFLIISNLMSLSDHWQLHVIGNFNVFRSTCLQIELCLSPGQWGTTAHRTMIP